jgi:endonuclease/exonuclease/phosphatase family metal-dependent hydrolase
MMFALMCFVLLANCAEFFRREKGLRDENAKIPHAGADRLRVVTYNVDQFAFIDGLRSPRLPPLADRESWKLFVGGDMLADLRADVFLLNEWPGVVVGNEMQAALVSPMAEKGYALVAFCGDPFWKRGNAIFARAGLRVESLGSDVMAQSRVSKRCLAKSVLAAGDHKIYILSTHLDNRDHSLRLAQYAQVEQEMSKYDTAVLGGDFNSAKFPEIVGGAMSCPSPTFASSHKSGRVIDFIFTKGDVRSTYYGVYHSEISDHLPVIMDVELRRGREESGSGRRHVWHYGLWLGLLVLQFCKVV